MKEIYLYSPIYDFVAESIISQMDENMNEGCTMRMNCGGGDVMSGWGIAAKMQECKTTIKVDGAAMSMGAILLAFADKVECLDVSTFMLHRASMYCETPEDQTFLDTVNSQLRDKLTSRIDAKKLKELKGVSIKNLFEDEKRIDLFLTAKEAKAIGLVHKINSCNPKEINVFNERFKVAAEYTPESKSQNQNIMTLEKLKAEHPSVFAQILALGVTQEKERIEAILAFNDIDPVATKELIANGKNLGQKEMAEFTVKAIAKSKIEAVKKDSTGAVTTEEVTEEEKTEHEKELLAFDKETRKACGLK